MRRIIVLLLTSIFLISSSLSILADGVKLGPYQPETVEEAVELANSEIGYEYFEVEEIHKEVWEKYLSLVYGAPHGDKKGNEYRYLGYNSK